MNAERRKELNKAIGLLQQIGTLLDEAKEIISGAAEQEREAYDNLSEGLQAAERGQKMDEAASALENVVSTLDDVDVDSMIGDIETAAE